MAFTPKPLAKVTASPSTMAIAMPGTPDGGAGALHALREVLRRRGEQRPGEAMAASDREDDFLHVVSWAAVPRRSL